MTAFENQWQQTGPSKQLLIILTHLTKAEDDRSLTIPLAALEQIEIGEGLTQAIEGNNLVLRYTPKQTRMLLVDSGANAERRPVPWPTTIDQLGEVLEESLTGTPSRFEQKHNPPPPRTRTTLNDQEQAERESVQKQQTDTQRRARAMRDRPLPMHPLRVPEQ